MRILIILSSNPGDGFLVKLTDDLVQEIKKHINRRDNSKAIVAALTKGEIEREVGHREVHEVNAKLILTRDRACWDVTRF